MNRCWPGARTCCSAGRQAGRVIRANAWVHRDYGGNRVMPHWRRRTASKLTRFPNNCQGPPRSRIAPLFASMVFRRLTCHFVSSRSVARPGAPQSTILPLVGEIVGGPILRSIFCNLCRAPAHRSNGESVTANQPARARLFRSQTPSTVMAAPLAPAPEGLATLGLRDPEVACAAQVGLSNCKSCCPQGSVARQPEACGRSARWCHFAPWSP
jgi:hypothetical protein